MDLRYIGKDETLGFIYNGVYKTLVLTLNNRIEVITKRHRVSYDSVYSFGMDWEVA